jgi:hypothetical protein
VLRSIRSLGQPKIYPNLNPSAAVQVNRDQIFSLRSFADNYRMSRGKEHGHYVPNARFVFVTMTNGELPLLLQFQHLHRLLMWMRSVSCWRRSRKPSTATTTQMKPPDDVVSRVWE